MLRSLILFISIIISIKRVNSKPLETTAGTKKQNEKQDIDVFECPWCFEGDMKLTPYQKAEFTKLSKSDVSKTKEPAPKRNKRKATSNLSQRWPKAAIPYTIHQGLREHTNAIQTAIRNWEQVTCVRFYPTDQPIPVQLDHSAYLNFYKGDGCWSSVGMVTYSGSQEVSIGGGCQYVNSIIHEIGHALGFIHEHSRYDRDDYIQIMTDNIMEGRLHNFYKAELHDVITEGVRYDTSSIMHYGTKYFTKNGQETIKARDVIDQWKLDHRDGLSFYDIKLANYIYNCNASCELLPCENGGYVGPECNCVCNQGFSGNLCEVQEPANRGCVYRLTNTHGVIMSEQYPSNYANYQDCLILISGQVGSTIVLTFEHFDVELQEDCLYDYLEIRSQNIDKDGAKYCGSSLPPQIESVGNEILLKFFTDASITKSGFKATYNVMDHLGHWSEWSDCFPSCAISARQQRHRECAGTAGCNGRMFEEKDCAIDSCIVEDEVYTKSPSVTGLQVTTTVRSTTDDPVTELRATCEPNICKNGGEFDARCECLCKPGYYGTTCELKYPSALDCTYKLVDSKGNITSPGFPSNYVNELDCNILISGGEGTTIKLTFEYIDIEDVAGCIYDYIDVRPDDIHSDGNKYCGTTLPPVIESSREEMLLRFYTDISITETGFRARYEIINHLSEWNEWSNCSSTCDGGVQNRTRECNRTWPCNVPLFEERPCNEEPCHVFSEWTSWSECVDVYGHYDRVRLRFCPDGDYLCSGSAVETVSCDADQERFPEQRPSPGALESDMILTEKQKATIARLEKLEKLDEPEPNARKAISDLSRRWPNKLVYYSITSGSEPDRINIKQALANWSNMTCLRFEEVPSGSNISHIQVIKGRGCYSKVGFVDEVPQNLSIGQGCSGVGTIMHEFGHALGFFHEQSRPDRDEHIRVNYTNIISGYERQFQKYPTSRITTENVPYDVGSIMHYGEDYYSSNHLPTISIINPLERARVGNRDALTFYDVKLANLIYQCSAGCSPIDCQNEGYVGPHCACVCKDGFYGPNCELQDYECSYTIEALAGIIDSPNFPQNYENNMYCTAIIKAPEGETITLTFTALNVEYENSCEYDYVEVRDSVDSFESSQRFCGAILPEPITGEGNQLAVIFRSDQSVISSGFSASYVISGGIIPTESNRVSTTENSGLVIDGCNIESNLESGTFTSPNYPALYDNDLDCTYTINVAKNQIITLSFIEFRLEAQSSCVWDYLLVDGVRYCGTNSPATLTSDIGSSLTFALHSDYSIGAPGFLAEYSVRTLDGTYTNFFEWSECVLFEPCGSYRRFRTRICTKGPGQCFGPAVESEECTVTGPGV
ncbi:uncharacterized protein LOC117108667 [Anneissia japonica]|uniref:uncharacterized protein LOC117108667 n=1 Tax=Anneissia japonica TaxID=1529436 RepID=UPI001425656D|nr:uncharacterized protein LOC117108667 [Anneissia japonica]